MSAHLQLIHTLKQSMDFWDTLGGQAEDALSTLHRFTHFIASHEDCFERTLLIGHVTGSALITDANAERVLLTHHRKLNKWLQLGGHADGDPDISRVAFKEAEEESGLLDLSFHPALEKRPLDLDIHEIPERPGEPRHYHYDVRYLFRTQAPDSILCSEESHALRWFYLDEVPNISDEPSLLRQIHKLRRLQGIM